MAHVPRWDVKVIRKREYVPDTIFTARGVDKGSISYWLKLGYYVEVIG